MIYFTLNVDFNIKRKSLTDQLNIECTGKTNRNYS